MAVSEQRLRVRLEAENAKLHKELNKSKAKLTKFSSHASKHAGMVTKALAAIGVGLVIRKFARLAKEALAVGDELAKTSAQLGITTERLAGLNRAAEITGVQQKTLHKSLIRMQKALFDADSGLLTYKRHFDTLNLSTKEMMKLSPADQFGEIASALNKVENQTLKTAIAYDIFGGRGTALINTIAVGKEGLKAFQQQAEYLGTAISKDTAKKMEDLNDSMVTLNDSFLGSANVIVQYAGPAFTEFINSMALGMPQYVRSFAGGILTIKKGFLDLSATYYDAAASFNEFWSKVYFGGKSKTYVRAQRAALERALELRLQAAGLADDIVKLAENIEKYDVLRKSFEFKAGKAVGEGGASPRVKAAGVTADKILSVEKSLQKRVLALRDGVASKSIGLLSALGVRSKAFAVAALLAESVIAAKRIYISSRVAAMAALTPPPIGLGPIAGAALSASILSAGTLSAGLTLATGAVNIANTLDTGGSGSVDPGNAAGLNEINEFTSGSAAARQTDINIVITGGIADRDTAETIADSLRDYFEDGGRGFAT